MSDLVAINPSRVEVWFPKVICQEPGAGEFFTIDQPPQAGIDAGQGVKVIHETMIALYATGDGTGEPDNISGLNGLAQRLAGDYYGYRSTSFDQTYNGVIPLLANALVDEFIWSYTDSSSLTRMTSALSNDDPEEYQHTDCSACGKLTLMTALACLGHDLHPTATQVDVTLDSGGKIVSVGEPYTSTLECCDCPPSLCPLRISVSGCMVEWDTAYTAEGNFPFQAPTSVANPDIDAEIVVTASDGTSWSGKTDATNNIDFDLDSKYNGQTLTVTARASGYLTSTTTIVFQCPLLLFNDPFANWVQFHLCPTEILVWAQVSRCDYPGAAPIYDDGSHSLVEVSGVGTAASDRYGNAFITVPMTACTSPSEVVVTASGPAPYYETDSATVDLSIAQCVTTVGLNPPLNSNYVCCLAGQTPSEVGPSPQQRPFPVALNATVDGVSVPLAYQGGCEWVGCQTIHGLCCVIVLTAHRETTWPYEFSFALTITVNVKANQGTPIRPWVQANCQHWSANPFVDPKATVTYYPPGCPTCECDQGDGFDPYQMGVAVQEVITYYLIQPAGPGWQPLDATCFAMEGCSDPGCPFQGVATITE